MTNLKLSKAGKTTTVTVNRNPWSTHPNAGTIPQQRMRKALRRIDAHTVADCQHDARELWAFHDGYFVAWGKTRTTRHCRLPLIDTNRRAIVAKVNLSGNEIDFDAAVNLMDDDIREELHAQGIDTEQDFLDAYATAHRAKFGEDFVVN